MIGRFVKGAKTLDVNSGRYGLDSNLAPPSTPVNFQMAMGLALNTRGGGRKVNEKAEMITWPITIDVNGSDRVEVLKAVSDLRWMLNQAGDETEPLYLEWKADDLPEPLWGQFGAVKRYKVQSATIAWELFALGATCDIELMISPYAEGKKQRLANCGSGVIEDIIGSGDGTSRGLIIAEATTNKCVNPVFGHATWNNGWTAGANLRVTQNKDARFLIWAQSSAKLTSSDTSNNTFTESINVANTNNHVITCWVKKPDGSAVTSADCRIYYGSAQTCTYTLVRNGIYKVSVSLSGVSAATATGIEVLKGHTIYLMGMLVEEAKHITRMAYGEMIGSSWSGTRHASTSARKEGQLKLTVGLDTFQASQGSIAVVWKTDYASTDDSDRYFFCDSTPKIYAYFKYSDDKIYFSDGTNTISSAAQTFSAGDVLHLVFKWGPSGLYVFKNGASIASGENFTPPASPTTLYIGSDNSTTKQVAGALLGFTIYDAELTSAQILAIYAAADLLADDDQLVDYIPWLWSKDGDGEVDQYDDTDHDNWVISGDIPGTAPAITDIKVTADATKFTVPFWLGLHTDMLNEFRPPTACWWSEQGGTVYANVSNDDVYQDGAVPSNYVYLTTSPIFAKTLFGNFHFFASWGDRNTDKTSEGQPFIRTNEGFSSGKAISVPIDEHRIQDGLPRIDLPACPQPGYCRGRYRNPLLQH